MLRIGKYVREKWSSDKPRLALFFSLFYQLSLILIRLTRLIEIINVKRIIKRWRHRTDIVAPGPCGLLSLPRQFGNCIHVYSRRSSRTWNAKLFLYVYICTYSTDTIDYGTYNVLACRYFKLPNEPYSVHHFFLNYYSQNFVILRVLCR